MKEVYKLEGKDGYGYKVEVNGFKINQPHKPCVQGLVLMTFDEATALAELAEKNINNNLDPTVTIPMMNSLVNGDCTSDDIIKQKLDLRASIEKVEMENPWSKPVVTYKAGVDGDKLELDPVTDVPRIRLKNGQIKAIAIAIEE